MNIRKLVKKLLPVNLFQKIEPYGHLAEAVLIESLNGFPAKGLKIIGVTGTNGKTSTCYFIHRMLHEAGYKVGLMTTVGYGVGDDIKPQIEHMTTVSVPELVSPFKAMRAKGIEWLVLETTSHALAQHRVWGVPYEIAVMTNVTHEHLDYHKTFERYRDAKRRLFQQTNANRNGLRVGVINADDASAKLFVSDIQSPLLYGINGGELLAKDITLKPSLVSYRAVKGELEFNIKCRLPGSFNVYNSLAAVAVGIVIGLTKDQIEQGIAALDGVEGRMTTIDEGQDFNVIVDFAHTPDSFEKLFKDVRPVVKNRLIVVFGSAGRRDEAKRAVQGKLAGQYADIVIVTEEDDRDVDGNQIMNQIAGGAESEGKERDKDLFLVHDRTDAIRFALNQAKSGDTVMFLGKGHEKTIERADGEHSWNETETVRQLLKQMLKG
ncbi:UDP-N-acetylmuramyl-tripeptide synthetase [Patescibacteria group bacterium]|nr:UDP-N-acetylmuramyl-tripeptide synthetase [Patescibacteria group bacterium]